MTVRDDTKIRNRYRRSIQAARRILKSEFPDKEIEINTLLKMADSLFNASYGYTGDPRYKDSE